MSRPLRPPASHDVRLRGFPDRAPLERVVAWMDRHAAAPRAADVPVGEAVGRVAVDAICAAADLPATSRAGEDGYAVRAADTVGASAYGAVVLSVAAAAEALPAGAAMLIAAGTPVPRGADAVLGFDAAVPSDGGLEVIAPVAPGSGIDPAGQLARGGEVLVPARRRLRPLDVALLAAAGVERVRVAVSPRVRVAVAGAKGGAADAHASILCALVARDSGAVELTRAGAALRDALERPGADVVLTTGRTGTGADDEAPSVLATAGELVFHGVALRPGGSVAIGVAAGRPVVLLPGDPLACACAYELVAGRLVRLLAGRDGGLPHRTCEAALVRKIVSVVGSVDVCQVRLAEGTAEPLGVAEFGGLGAAARADGFVVVPAALEGWPPGSRVTVHLH